MNSSGEVLLKLGELVVSSVIAILFEAYVSHTGHAALGVGWVIGAIIFLIFLMLEFSIRTGKAHEKYHATLSRIESTLAQSSTAQTLLLAASSFAEKTITSAETQEVWRVLSSYTQKTYWATNYIAPEAWYLTGHAQNVVLLQKAKIRTQPNFSLKKLLVWKDAAERDSMGRKIIALHTDDSRAKMNLRQILYGEIIGNKELKPLAESGMIDFAIFDDMVVFVWSLDVDRNVTGGKVFLGEDTIKKFKESFNLLWDQGEPVEKQ